jgi:hypothetical protein
MAFSCDPGLVSYEPRQGQNGYFTAALLKHLPADGEHVEHVFTRTARDCAAATAHLPEPQRPWKLAHLTETHVCLF